MSYNQAVWAEAGPNGSGLVKMGMTAQAGIHRAVAGDPSTINAIVVSIRNRNGGSLEFPIIEDAIAAVDSEEIVRL